MIPETFKAFLVNQTPDHQFHHNLVNKHLSELPVGEVLIQVYYSSLNYKDALSTIGHAGVTKKFPHIPGIDAAGIVIHSEVSQFQPGDKVIVTGFDLGMNTWGGFAEYIRVPATWIIPLPEGLNLRESMILGTAGLTAALCINELQTHFITPDSGEILVTGATGSVGSLAVSILAKIGYSVVAVTGKESHHTYLNSLGASTILSRQEVDDINDKGLLKERWAGAVDTVGGNILATLLKSTKYHGCVTCCGLVKSAELPTTIYPFILRGVRLIGIDSVQCPLPVRLKIWQKLATDWKPSQLEKIVTSITFEQLSTKLQDILNGQNVGRVILSINTEMNK